MGKPAAVLIAGPTASGKSALALRLAKLWGGAVVNADSMQVYDGLQILSARPAPTEMDGVPHHLYGHRDPALSYSVGDWLREAAPLVRRLSDAGLVPIVCGGTGLYFRALLGGLDEMPDVPPGIRAKWRQRMEEEGPARLHLELRARDAAAAERVRPSDPQRIVRALELFETRGASEAPAAVRMPGAVDLGGALKIVVAPERAHLRERIAARFDAMLEAGAREEALSFAERAGALDGLAGKAIGLRELLDAARGTLTPDGARERAIARTRQYAKRQETWFRNQFGQDWQRLADPAAYRP